MRAFDQQMTLISERWNDITDAASPLMVSVLRDGRSVRSIDDPFLDHARRITPSLTRMSATLRALTRAAAGLGAGCVFLEPALNDLF
jgi:hypothetical protein